MGKCLTFCYHGLYADARDMMNIILV